MQGCYHGNGLTYLTANISANKINLSRGQGYTDDKYCSGFFSLNLRKSISSFYLTMTNSNSRSLYSIFLQ